MKPAPVFLVSVFLLMACGGGGGGALNTPTNPGMPGETVQPPSVQPPSVQPPNQEGTAPVSPGGRGSTPTSPTSPPGLSAKGVTVTVAHNGNVPTFAVNKNGTAWTRDGLRSLPAGGDNGNWTDATTKLNADATQRFLVITDIAASSDADYMAFGYWSRHPSASLDLDNGFEPFYYGSMPYAGDVRNLSGQATYTYYGNATGAYSILDTSNRGYFTARVSLTASFGSGGQVEGRMAKIADIEKLWEEGRDPLSGFGDLPLSSAGYDSSGRSFTSTSCSTAGCAGEGISLGRPTAGRFRPVPRAGSGS